MAATFEQFTTGTTDQCDRYIPLIMDVRITHTGTIYNHGVIQQRCAVQVLGVLHLLQEFTKHLGMINIDLAGLAFSVGVSTMVGQRMIRIGMAQLGVYHFTVFACDHEGKDAGHVRLERQ